MPDRAISERSPSQPFYCPVADELEAARAAFGAGLPLLLKGPTGSGKSRLIEALSWELGRGLVTVACNDETSATDLLGRWLVKGGDTVWQDGPATRAARLGAVLYLDEVAEARDDILVVLHSLADHRRELWLDRRDERVRAAPGFQLVASYNPGYRRASRDLKPSTRQRFTAVTLGFPPADLEAQIVATETACPAKLAKSLVLLATKIRGVKELALNETVSTRLLVHAARLITQGLTPRLACQFAIVEPLTDDAEIIGALRDLVSLMM